MVACCSVAVEGSGLLSLNVNNAGFYFSEFAEFAAR
jgi:hypothetical protein